MRKVLRTGLVALAMCGFAAAPALAATAWDEAVHGDLSDDGLAPTQLSVGSGENIVLGTTGDSGQGIDRDYFTFTVPAGAILGSIVLLGNTSVSGSSSFIGVQAGPQITVSPTGGGADQLLGFAHYGTDQIGTDLLGVIHPSGALPAGTYSFWVQELGGSVGYGFDFAVSSVPEPATVLMMLGGLVGVLVMRRR